MKVAISILNMSTGGWHWVLRLWQDGPDKPFTVVAAKHPHESAARAFAEALGVLDNVNTPPAGPRVA